MGCQETISFYFSSWDNFDSGRNIHKLRSGLADLLIRSIQLLRMSKKFILTRRVLLFSNTTVREARSSIWAFAWRLHGQNNQFLHSRKESQQIKGQWNSLKMHLLLKKPDFYIWIYDWNYIVAMTRFSGGSISSTGFLRSIVFGLRSCAVIFKMLKTLSVFPYQWEVICEWWILLRVIKLEVVKRAK